MIHFLLPLCVFICVTSVGQSRLRVFSNVVNHPAINVWAPYISADGNTLVYLSDNTEGGIPTLSYTKKKDAVNWKEPILIPKQIIHNRLTFPPGFALSADGKTLYITSLQSGGLGGFDILISKLNGSVWSVPVNLGMPINSAQHEGCPSISIDGSTLYFMRCESMNQKETQKCALFISKKSPMGKWSDPVKLPAHINTGNSQAPRIMADNEMLIFSSNQFPENKGGMDLYATRFDGIKWSNPISLSFANTEVDDQYVSASVLSRYLLKDRMGRNKKEIVEIAFPTDLKPKSCMKVSGVIKQPKGISSSYITVFDQHTDKIVYSEKTDHTGVFKFFLKEGSVYDFAVEPEKEQYTFFSKIYDLTQEKVPVSSKVHVEIKPLTTGTEIFLEGIKFEPHTSKIDPVSKYELRRLTRMIKSNTNHTFKINVTFDGYWSDSLPSDSDLTEVKIDTLHFFADNPILSQKDSTTNFSAIPSKIDSVFIRKSYHNDRTASQAKAIIDLLVREGADPEKITASYNVLQKDSTAGNTPVEKKIGSKIYVSVLE